jgi:cobalt-zinc-cadmium efflux system protein
MSGSRPNRSSTVGTPERAAHSHDLRGAATRRLVIALLLTVSFMLVEVVVGLLSGSLALLSDAGHMLTDAGALALAVVAQLIAQRQRSGLRTFGYRRAEILAALANGVVLGASSIWIVVEAVRRFQAPTAVHGLPVLVVATLGLLVNLASAAVLSGAGRTNPNVRAAAAHVAADAAGSVAAMIAGLLVWLGWNRADPVMSIFISVLILWSAWKLAREALQVLMEGAPRGFDFDTIGKTIAETPGVAGVHDLHVWSISAGFPVVTVHVVLGGGYHGTEIATAVARRIREMHGIEHVTVQPEAPAPPLLPLASLLRQSAESSQESDD